MNGNGIWGLLLHPGAIILYLIWGVAIAIIHGGKIIGWLVDKVLGDPSEWWHKDTKI